MLPPLVIIITVMRSYGIKDNEMDNIRNLVKELSAAFDVPDIEAGYRYWVSIGCPMRIQ